MEESEPRATKVAERTQVDWEVLDALLWGHFVEEILPWMVVGALVFAGVAFGGQWLWRQWRAWRRTRWRGEVISSLEIVDGQWIEDPSWDDFERVCEEALRRDGWRTRLARTRGPDGGIDVVASRWWRRGRMAVQCKHRQRVGVEAVRELYGTMAAGGYRAAVLVCSGRFTKPAEEWAQRRPIRLVDGWQALCWFRGRNGFEEILGPWPGRSAATEVRRSPRCPRCGRGMVQRMRSGGNGYRWYWGCETFPGCKGERRVWHRWS